MTVAYRTLLDSRVEASNDQTFIHKLPRSGALHSLLLRCRMTNGSTSALNVNIFDVIDLIEVVADGSNILYSLIPRVMEKRHEILKGVGLQIVENTRADAVQEATFQIEFGRDLFDNQMWLPLSAFKDLELRIRYSPAISATVGFATGSFTIDLSALVSEELPNEYFGTIVTRNVHNVTSAASGDEIVELHRGNAYRNILVYAYEASVADGTDISDVELRLNDGERSLFRHNWRELQDLNAAHYDMDISHTILNFVNDDDTYNCRLSEPELLVVGGEHDADVAADTFDVLTVDAITGDRLTYNLSVADVTAGAETHVTQTALTNARTVTGLKRPSYAALLTFDWSPDPNEWLQTERLSRLQALITQGGAGADLRISVSEVMRFQQ